jgi:hypothetical protein
MSKEIKAKCDICGVIKVQGPWSNANEENFIVPTKMCPTARSLGMYYKKHTGDDYKWLTGVPIEENYEKEVMRLNHTNPDEDGDGWEKHLLEPLECWTDKSV